MRKVAKGVDSMSDDGKWELSREEIEERIRKSNQEWKQKRPTRGGRSSGQGVKLLYIRDYLYAHATKEHPQNANRIQAYLAEHGVEASVKTIYNDILRRQEDFDVPIEYNKSKWGYYITEPEFKPYELRLMVDSIQSSKFITQKEASTITQKIKSSKTSATDLRDCPFIVIFLAIIRPHAFRRNLLSGMRSNFTYEKRKNP